MRSPISSPESAFSALISFPMIPLFADVSSLGFSFIPILNVTASMALIIQGVPIFTLAPYLAITITMNLLLALGLVFLTGYLFRKEKVMITR